MKKENYLDLNLTQIEEKIFEGKKKLLDFRSDVANRKLKNTHEITHTRKDIAHLSTLKTIKKIEAAKEALKLKENTK